MSGHRAAYLTRREHFSASHRLYSSSLSEEENIKLYSKCANPNGHGHNYYVEVTTFGPIHPVTGMVLNLSDLKSALQPVLLQLDHKNIDLDVPHFQTHRLVSTCENIAVFIYDEVKAQLTAKFGRGELLYEVKLWETEKNVVVYRGE